MVLKCAAMCKIPCQLKYSVSKNETWKVSFLLKRNVHNNNNNNKT